MNVGAIAMDPKLAREAYREYSASVRGRMLDEYRAVREAYEELAKGHSIIDIKTALQIAGLDEKNRPKLAIVQADKPMCYLHRNGNGTTGRFSHFPEEKPRQKHGLVHLPPDVWKAMRGWPQYEDRARGMPFKASEFERTLRAVSPIVPPRFLPRDPLANYFIIFEPVWQQVPNPDPILCKRLNATTFAAVAQWDMTPVELMVLQGRLAQ